MATINIAYNGATLASLSGGQAATLKCAGQTMSGNIVLSFGIGGSVEYNGKTTAVKAGGIATLECARRKMLSDVVVTASADESEGGECTGTHIIEVATVSEMESKLNNASPANNGDVYKYTGATQSPYIQNAYYKLEITTND